MSNSTEGLALGSGLTSDQIANRAISFSVSGTISIIGSVATIWHILRSHKGLSSTYHRLLLGLCVGDLMSSFAYAVNSLAVPEEMKYLVPFARGNVGTCTASGFLRYVGLVMAALYNCSMCFYYLSIIKYNKKDEYIKDKLEPWFHFISISYALAIGFIGLANKGFNNSFYGGACAATPYNPPHCKDYENGAIPDGFTIPCGRGDTASGAGHLSQGIMYFLLVSVTPVIIFGTMFSMYKTVRNIEQKMKTYGAGALRLRAQQRQRQAVDDANDSSSSESDNRFSMNPSVLLGSLKNGLRRMFLCRKQYPAASRSNNATSQKRAVLYMATSYSVSWALTWVPIYIGAIHLQAILLPLQGFYNFIVYMAPKVRNARITRRGKLPWRKAITKALMSRGEKDRTKGRSLRTSPVSRCKPSMRQRIARSVLSPRFLMVATPTMHSSSSPTSAAASEQLSPTSSGTVSPTSNTCIAEHSKKASIC